MKVTIIISALAAAASGLKEQRHAPDWDLSQPMNGVTFERVKAISMAKPDRPTSRFSRLKHVEGKRGKHGTASALGRALRATPGTVKQSFQNISSAGAYATQYAIQCGWDGKPVWLLFDTGSSDTWAAKSDFECIDSIGDAHDQAACGFGTALIDDFGQGAVDELHFFLKYGSGEKISGPMGYSDLNCGGVSVSKQQVGLANSTYWHGNNATVGILGLAYPSITSAYYGAIGDEASWNSITYTPFLTNAIIQGGLDPVFSVAISKNSSDGVLAWGGLPPIDWVRGNNASTDLIVVSTPHDLLDSISVQHLTMIGKSYRSSGNCMEVFVLHHHPRWRALGPDHRHDSISFYCRHRYNNDVSPPS